MIIIDAVSLGRLNISKLDSGDWMGSGFGEISAKSNLGPCFVKGPKGWWQTDQRLTR